MFFRIFIFFIFLRFLTNKKQNFNLQIHSMKIKTNDNYQREGDDDDDDESDDEGDDSDDEGDECDQYDSDSDNNKISKQPSNKLENKTKENKKPLNLLTQSIRSFNGF